MRHHRKIKTLLVANRGEIAIRVTSVRAERAERAGVISEIIARPGQQVDAKDLLLVLKPAAT
jgi:pyruvate carboxylase